MKTFLLFGFVMTLNWAFAKQDSSFYDQYSTIDNVTLQGDSIEGPIIMEILTSKIAVENNCWNNIASELCVWHFQQERKLPFYGQTLVISIIYLNSDTGLIRAQNTMPSIPNLGAFAVNPRYRQLCQYTINNFLPTDLNNFTTAAMAAGTYSKADMQSKWFFQSILDQISRMNSHHPNVELTTHLKSIRVYYKNDQSKWSTEILDYLDSMVQKQLSEEEMLEIEDMQIGDD